MDGEQLNQEQLGGLLTMLDILKGQADAGHFNLDLQDATALNLIISKLRPPQATSAPAIEEGGGVRQILYKKKHFTVYKHGRYNCIHTKSGTILLKDIKGQYT